jgi:hypothetical protein
MSGCFLWFVFDIVVSGAVVVVDVDVDVDDPFRLS